MANKISVDTTEIMALKSNLKTNIGGIIKSHKSKKQSIYSRMQQVMNEYSDCYEIYSQASAIITLLDEADAASKRIEPLYEQLISGLEYTISSTKQCERDIKRLLSLERLQINKVRDKNTRTVRSRGLNKDSDLIEEAMEKEIEEETIEGWGKEKLKEIEEDSLLFGRKSIDSTSQDLQINREALETVKVSKSLSEMSFQKEGTHPKINLSSSGYAEAIEKKRLDKISTYTSLLNQSLMEGKGEPQWLLDALAALGAFGGALLEKVEDEIEARKKQEEERLKDIQSYAYLLNEYRSSGRDEPQWLLDKLEELGAPYGVAEKRINIGVISLPLTGEIGNLSEKEVSKYIGLLLKQGKLTINDIPISNDSLDITNEGAVYEAIQSYLAYKGDECNNKYKNIYDTLSSEGQGTYRDKLLLYWLTMDMQDKDITSCSLPRWWLKEKETALNKYSITEENYGTYRQELTEVYNQYIWVQDLLADADGQMNSKASFWYEEQYGYLNSESTSTQRIKYVLSKTLNIDLLNAAGLYDDKETLAYQNARNLWLNLYGMYDDYWKGLHVFTSNNKIFKELIEKAVDEGIEVKNRDLSVEKLIVNGEYRQANDFIDKLNEWFGYEVKVNADGTITISVIMADGLSQQDIGWRVARGEEVTKQTYTLKVDAFEYQGVIYLNSEQFDTAFNQYLLERQGDSSYVEDFQSIYNPELTDEATRVYSKLCAEYPDLKMSYEQVYSMLRAEAEKELIYSPQKTVSDSIQDAGQALIDVAAIAVSISGHPYIGLILEAGNTGVSGTRENYDEMAARLIFLSIGGAIEVSSTMKTIKIANKQVANDTLKLLKGDDIVDVITVGGELKITLKDGTEILCKEADIAAETLKGIKTATDQSILISDDISTRIGKYISSGNVKEIVEANDNFFIKFKNGTSITVSKKALNGKTISAIDDFIKGASKSGNKFISNINQLTESEREALIRYSGSDYYENLNNALRGEEEMWNVNKQLNNQLKEIFDHVALEDDITVYRGSSQDILGTLKGAPEEQLIGRAIVEKGYMSTSVEQVVAEEFADDLVITINAPKGTAAIDISNISEYSEELEYLFNSNQEMIINNAKYIDDILYLDVTIY